MKLGTLPVVFLSALLAGPAVHAAKEDQKGHGAGGVRTEQASEQGLEKGKAWAGSKEKKEQDQQRERTEPKEKIFKKAKESK